MVQGELEMMEKGRCWSMVALVGRLDLDDEHGFEWDRLELCQLADQFSDGHSLRFFRHWRARRYADAAIGVSHDRGERAVSQRVLACLRDRLTRWQPLLRG